MDAYSTPGDRVVGWIDVVTIFPPATIAIHLAQQIADFSGDVDKGRAVAVLSKEPRQKDSLLVIATIDGQAAGCMKLQHGKAEELWIRLLVTDPRTRLATLKAIYGHVRETMGAAYQLVAEVSETDTAAQHAMRDLGLDCQPLSLRTKRQREKNLYEFRSWTPPAIEFQGQPRFTWPPIGSTGGDYDSAS